MKRVFGNADQVIHLWANQSQSDARCKNAFFRGTKVYSYGSHYLLGDLVRFNGVTVALINDNGYSVTTAKHISSAWHAVEHLPRVKVLDFASGCIERGMIRAQDALINELFNHFNATKFRAANDWDEVGSYFDRRKSETYGELGRINAFNSLCDVLGFKSLKLDINEDFISTFNAHVTLRLERDAELSSPEAQAKRDADRLKREANALINLERAVDKWRLGGTLTKAMRELLPQRIRVSGDEVETTRGASVPLDHALRLLKLVKSGKVKAGERVGNFSVSSISNEIIKIGCHDIALSEVDAVLGGLVPRMSLVQGGV